MFANRELIQSRNKHLKALIKSRDAEAAFADGAAYILTGLESPRVVNAKYIHPHAAGAYMQIRDTIRKNEQNNRSLTELKQDLNEKWRPKTDCELESREELQSIGWELFSGITRTFPLIKKLDEIRPSPSHLENHLNNAFVNEYAKKFLTIEITTGVRLKISHPEDTLDASKYDYASPDYVEISLQHNTYRGPHHPVSNWINAKDQNGNETVLRLKPSEVSEKIAAFISDHQDLIQKISLEQYRAPARKSEITNTQQKPQTTPQDSIERIITQQDSKRPKQVSKWEARQNDRDKAEAELDEIKKEYEKQLEKLTKLHDEFEPFLEPYVGTRDQGKIRLDLELETSATFERIVARAHPGITEIGVRKALVREHKRPCLILYLTGNKRIKFNYGEEGNFSYRFEKYARESINISSKECGETSKRWHHPLWMSKGSGINHYEALHILKQELAKAIQHNRDKRGKGIKGFFGASVGITIGLGTLFSAAHENVSVDDVISAVQNDNAAPFVVQDQDRAFTL